MVKVAVVVFGSFFCPFFLFFWTTTTSLFFLFTLSLFPFKIVDDRSIIYNRSIERKNKQTNTQITTTTTSSSGSRNTQPGRASQTAVSGKNTEKTRETKREVKRKRDEWDGGEGWRRFRRDLEFDDDDDDGTTTTTTTTLR